MYHLPPPGPSQYSQKGDYRHSKSVICIHYYHYNWSIHATKALKVQEIKTNCVTNFYRVHVISPLKSMLSSVDSKHNSNKLCHTKAC